MNSCCVRDVLYRSLRDVDCSAVLHSVAEEHEKASGQQGQQPILVIALSQNYKVSHPQETLVLRYPQQAQAVLVDETVFDQAFG